MEQWKVGSGDIGDQAEMTQKILTVASRKALATVRIIMPLTKPIFGCLAKFLTASRLSCNYVSRGEKNKKIKYVFLHV